MWCKLESRSHCKQFTRFGRTVSPLIIPSRLDRRWWHRSFAINTSLRLIISVSIRIAYLVSILPQKAIRSFTNWYNYKTIRSPKLVWIEIFCKFQALYSHSPLQQDSIFSFSQSIFSSKYSMQYISPARATGQGSLVLSSPPVACFFLLCTAKQPITRSMHLHTQNPLLLSSEILYLAYQERSMTASLTHNSPLVLPNATACSTQIIHKKHVSCTHTILPSICSQISIRHISCAEAASVHDLITQTPYIPASIATKFARSCFAVATERFPPQPYRMPTLCMPSLFSFLPASYPSFLFDITIASEH